ncbi:MAG: Spore protein SP21 [Phycisphaerae bacterium]|nr:Spore protein SP21 [Phycisphaerae bacterium]
MLRRNSLLWNPLDDLQRQMGRLFDDLGFRVATELGGAATFPAINVWEDQQSVMIEAEVPGVRREDVEITTAGDELVIKGSRERHDGAERTYQRRERGVGEFSRVVTLPCRVDPEHVDATLRDGVLTVRLTKSPEALPRKITVRTN